MIVERISGNHGGRLGAALLASVVAHAWLLATLPQVGRPQARSPVMLTVLLEMSPEMGSDSIFREVAVNAVLPGSDELPVPRKTPRKPSAPPHASNASEHVVERKSSLTLGDPTWYGAHDLDAYPRALAPLRFDAGHPGQAGGRLLLWLRIDELGQVVEVTAGEAGVPAELVAAARAVLAAVTFAPARKDERAVKSLIQVSLTY